VANIKLRARLLFLNLLAQTPFQPSDIISDFGCQTGGQIINVRQCKAIRFLNRLLHPVPATVNILATTLVAGAVYRVYRIAVGGYRGSRHNLSHRVLDYVKGGWTDTPHRTDYATVLAKR